jgi:hypothetical protein
MADEALTARNAKVDMKTTLPMSLQGDWVTLSVAPETADNGGNVVVNPTALGTTTPARWQKIKAGTTLMVMLGYDDELASITECVIQAFGRDNTEDNTDTTRTPIVHVLKGRADDDTSVVADAIELTTDTTNNVTDGTLKYTDPVKIDLDGATEVLIAIKTALAGTGTKTNSVILVKVI